MNNFYILLVGLEYYNISENNFKIIEQKNSIIYSIKNNKYKIVFIGIDQLINLKNL